MCFYVIYYWGYLVVGMVGIDDGYVGWYDDWGCIVVGEYVEVG